MNRSQTNFIRTLFYALLVVLLELLCNHCCLWTISSDNPAGNSFRCSWADPVRNFICSWLLTSLKASSKAYQTLTGSCDLKRLVIMCLKSCFAHNLLDTLCFRDFIKCKSLSYSCFSTTRRSTVPLLYHTLRHTCSPVFKCFSRYGSHISV